MESQQPWFPTEHWMTGAYPVCVFMLLSSWEQWWQLVTGWESRGLDEIKLMVKVKLLSTLSLQIITYFPITRGLDALEGMCRFSQQANWNHSSHFCVFALQTFEQDTIHTEAAVRGSEDCFTVTRSPVVLLISTLQEGGAAQGWWGNELICQQFEI